ncbi:hypothetical protein EIN_523640 [Entamoeba invadens IP1]|uniref:MIB/HERC2 domain-containing protein n=1 Tax=Entamoeba invadens IP1 TaxID=370355 RepID=A0A0A1UBA8_ENTIV|nr:hypothetical protein EIN_523640 [Entamoeba invadens IP1]ELP92466.1 hypothetical protein EIN_523640 [Entamoeba invadens IP1]|eukprot:XP_004259237.1 hypothetical protein EIN_523640 [Entamoeba invadens IP1]
MTTLTPAQQNEFESQFVNLVLSFSKSVSLSAERTFIQVLPLTVHSAASYLAASEKALRDRLDKTKDVSNQLFDCLKLTDEKIPKQQEEKFPPINEIIGKRVSRGRDWKWDEQDGGKGHVGKVVSVKGNGWVKVLWNPDGQPNRYRWGVDGMYDLRLVDTTESGEMLTMEQQTKKEASWTVGKVVKRGRDWKWENQDGGEGNTGIVIDVADDGWVEVKWKNGEIAQYRWGDEGKFDLEVVTN